MKISRSLHVKEKLACITLDFETDYGDRVGEFNILRNSLELRELANLFSDLCIPVSAFIRTDLLTHYPQSLDLVRMIAVDFHCHSHTHNTRDSHSEEEITVSATTFRDKFGYWPLGYRAAQGVLHEGDAELIERSGFKFSSSVFPSYRPGKFNNLTMPQEPFVYENGILELPFAVIPKVRYIISLSYLKLLGFTINRMLYSTFGFPSLLVFDSHLHDFIYNDESFRKLPTALKLAWGINKHSGVKCFVRFIELLKRRRYRFLTMTEAYHYLKERYL